MKELTDFEVYKLLDTFNLLEATCLIVGVSPNDVRDSANSTNDFDIHERYYLNGHQNSANNHFPLVLNALIRGVEFKKIEALKICFYNININENNEIIDPLKTCIEKPVLVEWLKNKGVYPDALFPLEPDNEILNMDHPFYSQKLALIVETWQQLKYAELNNQTVKNYVETLIRENHFKYGFKEMGETSISTLAEIVNFDKGGRRITGNLMEAYDTNQKKQERLEKKQENIKEFKEEEGAFDLPF